MICHYFLPHNLRQDLARLLVFFVWIRMVQKSASIKVHKNLFKVGTVTYNLIQKTDLAYNVYWLNPFFGQFHVFLSAKLHASKKF